MILKVLVVSDSFRNSLNSYEEIANHVENGIVCLCRSSGGNSVKLRWFRMKLQLAAD